MVSDAKDIFNGDVTSYGLFFLTCISKHVSHESCIRDQEIKAKRNIRDSDS